jgi:hypothetical protein
VLTDDDCDDANASLGDTENDADCDGVLTDDDCDDANASLGDTENDADCDGVLTDDDCDDANASLGDTENDADCDGVLTDDDCDDANASLRDRENDADCDGVILADDCDDGDEQLGAQADDGDCDGVLIEADCNDGDVLLGARANDGDCDGVLLGVDCNDNDPAVTTREPDCVGFRALAVGPLTVNEDATTTVTLLTAGGDGSTVTWQAEGTQPGATLSVTGDVLSYRGPADVGGVDDVIRLTPRQGTTVGTPTTLTVRITAVNDPPSFLVADALTTSEDVDLVGVALASAVSVGPLESQVATVTVDFSGASAIVDDVVDVAGDGSSFTILLVPDASGTGTLSVTVTDNGSPAASTTQDVLLTVTPVNDPPRLTPAPVTVTEDASLLGVVLATGVVAGPPNENEGVQLVSVTAPDSTLVVGGNLTGTLANGTLTIASGSLVADANGTQTLSITVADNGSPAASVTQDVLLTVTPVNDPPRLTPATVTVAEDASLLGVVLATGVVAGPPNETQSVQLVSVTAGAGNTLVAPAGLTGTLANGTLTIATGSLVADANGTQTLSITVADNGSPASRVTQDVLLTVTPVNDPPRLTPATVTVTEDASLLGVVLATGVVAGPPNENEGVQLVSVTAPDSTLVVGGNLTGTLANGTLTIASGSLVADANGTQTLSIIVADNGSPASRVAQDVLLTVTAVNDPPRLTGAAVTLVEDSVLVGEALVTNVAAGPANESGSVTLSVTRSSGADLVDLGTLTLGSTGTVTAGALRTNKSGTDVLTVTARDQGGATASATVNLVVNSVDDCLTDNGGCEQLCSDNGTAVTCSCNAGFTLAANGTSCVADGAPNACINVPGRAAHATIVVGTGRNIVVPNLTLADGTTPISLSASVDGLDLSPEGGGAPTSTRVDASAVTTALSTSVVGTTTATPSDECVSLFVVDVGADNVVAYVGPNGGSWEVTSNWSPARQPQANDTVLIESGKHVAVPAGQAFLGNPKNVLRLWVENGGSVTLGDDSRIVVGDDALVGGQVIASAASGLQPAFGNANSVVAGKIDTLICNNGGVVLEGPPPEMNLGGPLQATRVVKDAGGGLSFGGTCAIHFNGHRLSTTEFLVNVGEDHYQTMTNARAQLVVSGDLTLRGVFNWTDGTVEVIAPSNNGSRSLTLESVPLEPEPPATSSSHRLVVHGGTTVNVLRYQGAIVATGTSGTVTLNASGATNPNIATVAAALNMTTTTPSQTRIGTLLTSGAPNVSIQRQTTVNCDSVPVDGRCVVFDH